MMPKEAFIGYDQTIANGVGPTSLELVLLNNFLSLLLKYYLSFVRVNKKLAPSISPPLSPLNYFKSMFPIKFAAHNTLVQT
jgi:hypothetical protein